MRALAGMLLVIGCKVPDTTFVGTDAGLEFVEVASFPSTPNNDIDILFVVDDSPGASNMNIYLAGEFGRFIDALKTVDNQLPNIHIGVISGDVGTTGTREAVAGPAIGVTGSPGACSGNGKAGNLLVNSGALNGNFISDTRNTDGSRTHNMSQPINNVFSQMVAVGSAGCEYEQPLHAARLALNSNPNNAGFLRPNAALAVIFVTNEDDCSFSRATFLSDSTLGPLTSFRCTRYGVTCDYGGVDPDGMNTLGPKASCRASTEGRLELVDYYTAFFKELKADPRNVTVRVIAGLPDPLVVETRNNNPALARTCGNSIDADPAVRLHQVSEGVSRRRVINGCGWPYTEEMTELAHHLSGMLGGKCIERHIPSGSECVLEVNGVERPKCAGAGASNCYSISTSAVCPHGAVNVSPLAANEWATLRCRL